MAILPRQAENYAGGQAEIAKIRFRVEKPGGILYNEFIKA